MKMVTVHTGILAAAALALVGCNGADQGAGAGSEAAPAAGAPMVEGAPLGERILLKDMRKSIQVEMRASSGEALVEVRSRLEERSEAAELESRLGRAGSLSEVYALVSGRRHGVQPCVRYRVHAHLLERLRLGFPGHGDHLSPVLPFLYLHLRPRHLPQIP